MRQLNKSGQRIRRHLRRGVQRKVRRNGSLLGLVGMAALGYTLLEKNRRDQQHFQEDPFVDWDSDQSDTA